MLYHSRWRKKKAESYIIPPTYFKSNYSIVEVTEKKPESSLQIAEVTLEKKAESNLQISEVTLEKNAEGSLQISEEIPIEKSESSLQISGEIRKIEVKKIEIEIPKSAIVTQQTQNSNPQVSALSLASIKAKRELELQNKSVEKETVHLPTETFTQTEMQLFWNKYAQRLGDKGYKIIESLLLLNDPTLEGTTIVHELPNEGSKIEFESEKVALLGYLRGHLHNHDITIEVRVNEAVENKFAFTPQDKYNRLNQLNPSLELLRKTFDLDF